MKHATEDAFDRLMDDMQVLYAMRAGHVVSQDDIDALNRLDSHWRSEEERATDAYHRGWTDGLRQGGGESAVAADARADEAWIESASQKMMRALAEQRVDALREAAQPLANYIGGWADLHDSELVSVRVDALRNLAAAIAKATTQSEVG